MITDTYTPYMPSCLFTNLATYIHDSDFAAAIALLPEKLLLQGLWPVPNLPCIDPLQPFLDDLIFLLELLENAQPLPSTAQFESYYVPYLIGMQELLNAFPNHIHPFTPQTLTSQNLTPHLILENSEALKAYFHAEGTTLQGPKAWIKSYHQPKWFFAPRSCLFAHTQTHTPIAHFHSLSAAIRWKHYYPHTQYIRTLCPC